MRILLVLCLLLAGDALADEQFHSATIIDAGQDSNLSVGLFGGLENRNGNTLTVELDGMRYTVDYQTILKGGKNASSRFVVGSNVQALVHGKRLWIRREDGKTLKVMIVRRAIAEKDRADQAPGSGSGGSLSGTSAASSP